MKQSGQTLIELIVAVAVMSTGLFAAANLAMSNLQLSDRDMDDVVAVNLAREGIELAKARRDSNWLAGRAFGDGFSDGATYTAIPLWDGKPANQEAVFRFIQNGFSNKGTVIHQSSSSRDVGFFNQTDAAAAVTPWTRLLTFHPICSTPAGLTYLDNGADCMANPEVGIRVQSEVRWIRRGIAMSRVAYDDLYDWK